MIATFACVVVCIIWMWIMVAVLECKKDKKPSAWEKILFALLMVGGVFVLSIHNNVWSWNEAVSIIVSNDRFLQFRHR